MCSVSYIGDQWSQKDHWPTWPQQVPFPPHPTVIPNGELYTLVTRREYDDLKRQVEEMKAELEKARAQDIAENNPDCEMEEKVVVLKAIAKLFGISLTEVFPND